MQRISKKSLPCGCHVDLAYWCFICILRSNKQAGVQEMLRCCSARGYVTTLFFSSYRENALVVPRGNRIHNSLRCLIFGLHILSIGFGACFAISHYWPNVCNNHFLVGIAKYFGTFAHSKSDDCRHRIFVI